MLPVAVVLVEIVIVLSLEGFPEDLDIALEASLHVVALGNLLVRDEHEKGLEVEGVVYRLGRGAGPPVMVLFQGRMTSPLHLVHDQGQVLQLPAGAEGLYDGFEVLLLEPAIARLVQASELGLVGSMSDEMTVVAQLVREKLQGLRLHLLARAFSFGPLVREAVGPRLVLGLSQGLEQLFFPGARGLTMRGAAHCGGSTSCHRRRKGGLEVMGM
mmetsp:Transcript_10911/g.26203  ORF Transcript_10911/g.26203 Transcript_10911/m.26203 type:complete len:214 (-) Transcript_10911:163-804(-)